MVEIVKENILYEDDVGIVQHGNSAVGHLQIIPKKEIKKIDDLSEEEWNHLFKMASIGATMVFEALPGEPQNKGTNILLNPLEGRLFIDVVPRSGGDEFDFRWDPKQLSEADMNQTFEKIKDKCWYIGKEEAPEKKEEVKQEEKDVDEEDPRLRYLRRIP